MKDKENKIKNTEEKISKLNSNNEKKELKKILYFLIVLFAVLLFMSTIFAILNINNEKIIKGIYIQGIDMSNKTEEEALNLLQNKSEDILKKDIILKYNEYSTSITPEQIELKIDYPGAVNKAQKIGKTNNILVDNFNILKSIIFKTNIDINLEYNKEVLQNMIKNINSELPGSVKEVTYEINDDKLIITNGKSGIFVNSEKIEQDIINHIKNNFTKEEYEILIPVNEKEADPINIEKIHEEIYKEAKDAYIEENPFRLHVDEDGLDFDITLEEAKDIINEEKGTYEIPLKIDKAKVKTEDLGEKLFKETLSKFTTIYDAGNKSRGTNISIAAKTINGTVILPGETFSYNKVLGNTTKEKGYQLGGSYQNGKVVQAYGGGICQVSTTLYNAVLYANLEIVERYNHSYSVSYVPASRDATVSYGGKDFKFKNSRTYPIKIEAVAKNGVVSVSIEGIKEEKEYDIEIKSTTLSTTPYKTTYQDNSSMQEGKEKVIQVGHNGMKSQAYIIKKYNGKIISKELLNADTYQPMNKIIERGTKKDNTVEEKKEEKKTEDAEVTENED